MDIDKILTSGQLSLALLGGYFLLDKTWTALTEFYMRRKIFNQPPPQLAVNSPRFAERELEERRRQVKFDHANGMIQLMRITGYTPEIAHNALKEIFKYAEGEAEKRHPYPDYWPSKKEST